MENNVNEEAVRDVVHKVEYILLMIVIILCGWWIIAKLQSRPPKVVKEIPKAVIIKVADPFISKLSTSTTKLKIAFTGDQGNTSETKKALAMIREENAEALVILGDFEYENNPELWKQNLLVHLGQNFPVIAVAGNHEEEVWDSGYGPVVKEQIDALPKGMCQSETPKDIGLTFNCTLGPVHIVLVTSDIIIAQSQLRNPAAYIQKVFKSAIANRTFLSIDPEKDNIIENKEPWRLCAWHKVHEDMQLGNKKDLIHWDIYEACQKFGAYIVAGHDHVYARSKTVLNFSKKLIDTSVGEDIVKVSPGTTGVVISGLGGKSIRARDNQDNTWWAETYTKEKLEVETEKRDSNIAGILFCTFDRNEDRTPCYFKTTDGKVRDEFILQR